MQPRVLLLDEPFGALDARVRKQLRQWLRTLHDEVKVTTVLVTHDSEEACEVADRVAVMHEGGSRRSARRRSWGGGRRPVSGVVSGGSRRGRPSGSTTTDLQLRVPRATDVWSTETRWDATRMRGRTALIFLHGCTTFFRTQRDGAAMRVVVVLLAVVVGLGLVVVIIGYLLPVKHVATVSATIPAAPDAVWEVLTESPHIRSGAAT